MSFFKINLTCLLACYIFRYEYYSMCVFIVCFFIPILYVVQSTKTKKETDMAIKVNPNQ